MTQLRLFSLALVIWTVLWVQGAVSSAQEVEAQEMGPIRWLLQPSEERELREAATGAERERLVERFWQRRSTPLDEGDNPNRRLFKERAAAADLLYGEPESVVLGSMTQRGRVHILLGPPSYLSQRYQGNPQWDTSLWQRNRQSPRPLLVETWGYRPEDLTEELREELTERGWPFELQVRFVVRDGQTFILEGERFLEAAARSFLRRGP